MDILCTIFIGPRPSLWVFVQPPTLAAVSTMNHIVDPMAGCLNSRYGLIIVSLARLCRDSRCDRISDGPQQAVVHCRFSNDRNDLILHRHEPSEPPQWHLLKTKRGGICGRPCTGSHRLHIRVTGDLDSNHAGCFLAPLVSEATPNGRLSCSCCFHHLCSSSCVFLLLTRTFTAKLIHHTIVHRCLTSRRGLFSCMTVPPLIRTPPAGRISSSRKARRILQIFLPIIVVNADVVDVICSPTKSPLWRASFSLLTICSIGYYGRLFCSYYAWDCIA